MRTECRQKHRIARALAQVLLAVAMVFLVAGSAFAAPANAAANKTVKVGYFEFGGMFEGASDGAEKSGYCYEYMMQLSVYTGWNCEFCYGSYSELYEKLKNGEIDVLPYTNYNDQRGKEVLFSKDALVDEEYYIAAKPQEGLQPGAEVESLNGTTISTLEGADYNDLLRDFIEENDLDVMIEYFPNLNETWDALRDGTVDATVFTSNAYSDDDWKCLCSFGVKPTYIAVSKDKPELLDEINEAASLVSEESPAFLGDLYEKYFSNNPMRKSLTPDEQAWIDAHPVLRVGGFANDAPYVFSYDEQTKIATGLSVDVVNGMIERLGLDATVDFRCYNSLDEMEAALDSGEIDVIIPFYPNYYVAQQHNLIISNTVRVSNMELVYKEGLSYAEALEKVATPATKLGIFYVQEFFPNSQIVRAESVQDAVDKVLSGEATGAIAQNVVMHNIQEKYDNLNYSVLPDGCGTCFAARPDNYPLIRAINRGLNFFSSAEISAIASQYSLNPNVTTKAYLSAHKEAVVMLVIIFAVLVALVFALLQVNRLKRQADAASASKTTFLFNLSHDIRTPMNAILGYTDIALRHKDEAERVDDSLKKIKTSGAHLLSLINDILEMSRIESGKLSLTEEPLDVREAIKGIDQMSQALAVPKSIDFNVNVGRIENPYVFADVLHVNQVIINLISNAVKYTPEGGVVRFSVEQLGAPDGGRVSFRFRVKDTGIGMSEEFQQRMFDSFAREESATVSKIEGAGLGLSIVKRIIDLVGGTIEVESKLGEGSIFTVVIPFTAMNESAIAEFEAKKEGVRSFADDVSFAGLKVLLVEDNEFNREIAQDILLEAGFDVETAEDGAIAVKTVSEKGAAYYDFILTDIQMPVMNGYEATRAIRKLPGGNDTVIIALSANAFKEDVERSLAAGMDGHVAKPIDIDLLFAELRKHL